MKDRTPTARIDEEACIGCESCVTICPDRTITMEQGLAVVSGDRCLACEHCVAVCPTGAVSLGATDDDALDFATFEPDNRWLAFGEFDTAQLVRLMRSRRSCRNFLDRAVERAVLEDLVKIGITAPSGTNSQLWTFTILDTRDGVMSLGERIFKLFERINAMAEKAWLRKSMKLIGKGQLDEYYREYYTSVKEGMEEHERLGTDRLFHGAPAAVVIGMEPGASCPAEDALLAAGNILLAAHAMGLGTCLIGYAVEAMKNEPAIKEHLGIPAAERVYAVIALGYPDESYERPAGRRKITPRYFSPPPSEAP